MDTNQIEELLDKYFADEMSHEETKIFEDLLENNEDLKRAYQLELKLNKNISQISLEKIKQKVSAADNQYHTNKTKIVPMVNTKNNSKLIIGIAASLFLVAAAYFFLKPNATQGIDQTDQYLSYLQNYENESLGKYALRGSNDDGITIRDSIALALHESTNGTVEKAKIILQDLIKRYPQDEEIQLYLAIQMFKSSDYKVAIEMLNQLVRSSSIDIKEEAEMTMAMATTSLNDSRATSIKWLKKIVSTPNHRHHKMAMDQLAFFE
jgi:hypothetical protein